MHEIGAMTAREAAGPLQSAAWAFALGVRNIVAAVACGAMLLNCTQALALSEIQQENTTTSDGIQPVAPEASSPGMPAGEEDVMPDSGQDDQTAPRSDLVRPDLDPNKPLPEVIYDVSRLPEPVQRMRRLIIEACKSGDIEKLRPLLGDTGDTQLSLAGNDEDPVKFLRELSGDDGGQEILAILLEVMQAGFVHLNAGTSSDIYVWPYFFAMPLDKLTPEQRVELFTLVTAGDYEDMKSFGAYMFYRVGITPEGRWLFFVAGD